MHVVPAPPAPKHPALAHVLYFSLLPALLQTCNEQPDIHERFMEMCGKVAGRWRTILGSSPEEMDVPIKVDEELYFEGKFDTEAM